MTIEYIYLRVISDEHSEPYITSVRNDEDECIGAIIDGKVVDNEKLTAKRKQRDQDAIIRNRRLAAVEAPLMSGMDEFNKQFDSVFRGGNV